MSLFANATFINIQGATAAKTPEEKINIAIKEQLLLLDETVPDEKKPSKKSWLRTVKVKGHGEKMVFDPRISNRSIFKGQAILCNSKEEAKGYIQTLARWQEDPELKKNIEDIYKEISKPKKKKD